MNLITRLQEYLGHRKTRLLRFPRVRLQMLAGLSCFLFMSPLLPMHVSLDGNLVSLLQPEVRHLGHARRGPVSSTFATWAGYTERVASRDTGNTGHPACLLGALLEETRRWPPRYLGALWFYWLALPVSALLACVIALRTLRTSSFSIAPPGNDLLAFVVAGLALGWLGLCLLDHLVATRHGRYPYWDPRHVNLLWPLAGYTLVLVLLLLLFAWRLRPERSLLAPAAVGALHLALYARYLDHGFFHILKLGWFDGLLCLDAGFLLFFAFSSLRTIREAHSLRAERQASWRKAVDSPD